MGCNGKLEKSLILTIWEWSSGLRWKIREIIRPSFDNMTMVEWAAMENYGNYEFWLCVASLFITISVVLGFQKPRTYKMPVLHVTHSSQLCKQVTPSAMKHAFLFSLAVLVTANKNPPEILMTLVYNKFYKVVSVSKFYLATRTITEYPGYITNLWICWKIGVVIWIKYLIHWSDYVLWNNIFKLQWHL